MSDVFVSDRNFSVNITEGYIGHDFILCAFFFHQYSFVLTQAAKLLMTAA